MTNQDTAVKPGSNFARLKNVDGTAILVAKLQNREPGLPGFGVVNGFSGYGKTYASIFAQNRTGAIRVEVGDSWNRTTLMKAILRECGEPEPRGPVADLTERAIMRLSDDPRRPLFIDEADKLADKNMLELVREVQEHSQVPVLLIGEENLPAKIAKIERVHNRVLDWYQAQPCDFDDCRELARIFLAKAKISDTLLDQVRRDTEGRARRIVVTMSNMAEWARNAGSEEITAAALPATVFTSRVPQRHGGAKPLRVARATGAAA